MGSLFKNYSIQKMNKEIGEMIQDDHVNNLQIFTASDQAKLSVTLKPMREYDQQYHGLHPKFDDKRLYDFLFRSEDKGEKDFWERIEKEQKDHHYMNLIVPGDQSDAEIEEILLGRAVLHMASHFGFRFKADDRLLETIQGKLAGLWKTSKESLKTPYWQIDANKGFIDLLGIWPDEIIKALDQAYKIYENDIDELVLEPCDSSIFSRRKAMSLQEFLTFQPEYKTHFKLRTSTIYYSGVMPRVMKIEYIDDPIAASDVKYLVFHVARTTFATVDFMDNPSLIQHPFFVDGKKNHARYDEMVAFDLREDQLQEKHLYNDRTNKFDPRKDVSKQSQRDYEKYEVDQINKYLKESFNTHTIAVSANIQTKDGYLLLGKRGHTAIDAGEYYCSANGQSEFRDENVSFYRKSVFEDLPSMDYEYKYRVDLNQEIERESVAELGLTAFDKEWKYLGVSYLSVNNYPNRKETPTKATAANVKSRRMHFNVLTANSTPMYFKEVIRSQEYAIEKFENSEIKGLKTTIYKNKADLRRESITVAYDWFYRNKSKIFIILLLITYILNKDQGSRLSLSNIFDISFVLIYIASLVMNYYKNKSIRMKKVRKSFLATEYIDKENLLNMINVFDDLELMMKLEEKQEKFHAIFRAMYMFDFLDKNA